MKEIGGNRKLFLGRTSEQQSGFNRFGAPKNFFKLALAIFKNKEVNKNNKIHSSKVSDKIQQQRRQTASFRSLRVTPKGPTPDSSASLLNFNMKSLFFVMMFVLMMGVAFAIPQTMNVHGKLTNSTDGSVITGSHTLTFDIYTGYTGGSPIYTSSQSVLLDENGVYHAMLNDVDINFSQQYYMGIEVNSDGEMTPRVNLTSSPYAFRANTSDYLETETTYSIGGLGIGTSSPGATLQVVGDIWADDWTNVSITESQISDLTHTVDTTIGNCSVSGSCGNILYTATAIAVTTVDTGSGAMDLGDAAVASGDSNSVPTGGQVFTFVEAVNTSMKAYVDSQDYDGVQNTSEEMQDAVLSVIDDGTQTNIAVTYDDANNDVDFVVYTIGNCSASNSCGNIVYETELSYIGNCSVSGSCGNIYYAGDKVGNTTSEIQAISVGGHTTGTISSITVVNTAGLGYQNITNFPTCGAGEVLKYDGTTISCVTVAGSSSAAGWVNDTLTTSTTLSAQVGTNTFVANVTSGNVGIGTTDPGAKLDVQGTLLVNNEIQFVDSNTRIIHANNLLQFRTDSGTTQVVIDSSGRLGIGNLNPNATLHVSGDVNISSHLTADGNVKIGGTLHNGNGFGSIQIGGATVGSNGLMAVRDSGVIVTRGGGIYGWETGANNPYSGTIDTSLSRLGAGVIAVGTGTTGEIDGTLVAASFNASDWSNVSITESQISDLTHTTDTTIGNCSVSGSCGNIYYLGDKVGNTTAEIQAVSLGGDLGGSIGTATVLNTQGLGYQNITNFPTCGAGEVLKYDGTTLSCVTVAGSSSAAGWVNDTLTTSTTLSAQVGTNTFVANVTSGNVGIGTTSPSEALEVVGTIDVTNGEIILSNDREINWGGSSEGISGSQSANTLTMKTNSAQRILIDSSGQVGIGTNNPSQLLELNSTNTALIQFTAGNGANGAKVGFQSGYGAVVGATTGNGFYLIGTDHIFTDQNLANEKMRINSGGFVGVNTSTPLTTLHVNGTILSEGAIQADDWTDVSITESQISDLTHIGNCSVSGSCGNIYYAGDKVGNTTAEIQAISVGGDVSGTIANIAVITTDGLSYTNISDFPTCAGGEVLTYDGTTFSCTLASGSSSAGGWSNNSLTTSTTLSAQVGTNTLVANVTSGLVGIGTSDPSQELHVEGNINSTGTTWVKAGDYTNPSIKAFAGDIALMGQDDIQLITGGSGSEAIYMIDGAGTVHVFVDMENTEVGIGTTSPATTLHVNGSGQIEGQISLVQQSSGANQIAFVDESGTVRWTKYVASGDLRIYDQQASTDRLVIQDSTGNVGIGNINPNATLDVSGKINATDWTDVSITESQISDLSHTVDTTIGNCSVSGSCGNILYTATAIAVTTVDTGSGAMDLGDAAVASGDSNSVPTGGQVFTFVEAVNTSMKAYVDSQDFDGVQNTSEEMQDAVLSIIDDGTQTNIAVTYDDGNNDVDFVVYTVGNCSASNSCGNIAYDSEFANASIVRATNTTWVTDLAYNTEGELTTLLDDNYVAIGTKLGNTTAEIQAVAVGGDVSGSIGTIAVVDTAGLSYTNITDFPTCSGGEVLTYDGTSFSCTLASGSSSAGGWNNNSLTTSTILSAQVGTNTFVANVTSGNIGIGTTDPGATLQVVGDIFANDWSNVSITESQISDLTHTTDTTIGNCSVSGSCGNIYYTGDKVGNTTAEIQAVAVGGDVSGTIANIDVETTQGLSTDNITSGTFADARIDSSIARDVELIGNCSGDGECSAITYDSELANYDTDGSDDVLVGWTNVTYENEFANASIVRATNTTWVTDLAYNTEGELTTLLDDNYVAIGTKLGNTTAEIQAVAVGGDVSGTIANIDVETTQGLSTDNITSGTFADARIDSSIARDVELIGNCSSSGSCGNVLYTATAIAVTTIDTGSGAMDLGDAAVASGDSNSVPTGGQVFTFVEAVNTSMKAYVDSQDYDGTQNTSEEMQDAVLSIIDDGTQTNIAVTYDDANNDVDFVVYTIGNCSASNSCGNIAYDSELANYDTDGSDDVLVSFTNVTYEAEFANASIVRATNTTWVTDLAYNTEGELTTLLDDNYVAIGTKLGNTTAEIQAVAVGGDVSGTIANIDVETTQGLSTDNITSGTFADARIDSSIARDVELIGNCSASNSCGNVLYTATAIAVTTVDTGSGAMDLGDAAVASGDSNSVPTGGQVFTFVENVNTSMKAYVDSQSSGNTTEEIQDAIGSMVTGNTETNIAVTYDDSNDEFDFVVYTVGNCSASGSCSNVAYDTELIGNCSGDGDCSAITYDSELAYIGNCSSSGSCGNVLYTATAIAVTTIDTGSGAMDLGDAAVASGDSNSVPTGGQVFTFVEAVNTSMKAYVDALDHTDDQDFSEVGAGTSTNALVIGAGGSLGTSGGGTIEATSGDSASSFFASGTIEEARIHSDIARDTELIGNCSASNSCGNIIYEAELTSLSDLNTQLGTSIADGAHTTDTTIGNCSASNSCGNIAYDSEISGYDTDGSDDVLVSFTNVTYENEFANASIVRATNTTWVTDLAYNTEGELTTLLDDNYVGVDFTNVTYLDYPNLGYLNISGDIYSGGTDMVWIDGDNTENPTINTTQSNITITSEGGSVIIRLGG